MSKSGLKITKEKWDICKFSKISVQYKQKRDKECEIWVACAIFIYSFIGC